MPTESQETRGTQVSVPEIAAQPERPEGAPSLPPIPDDALAIVPVRSMVMFPGMVVPVSVGREKSIAAAQAAARGERPLGILLQREADNADPSGADLYEVGTVCNVLRYLTAPDGSHHVISQGVQRFRVVEFLSGYPFLVARIARIEEPEASSTEVEARMHQLRQQALEALALLPNAPAEMTTAIQGITQPGMLADLVAGVVDLKPEEKQDILETLDLRSRLDKVLWFLAYRVEVLRLSRDIGQQTRQAMEGRQREHLLREQLRAIQKELGEGEEGGTDLKDLAKQIEEAGLPEEVLTQARKELKRLERMPEGAAEHGMVRTYLEWLAELPWSKESDEKIDITAARQVLDEDHYGLPKIKRRILEFLAVRKLAPAGKSPILCFAGPPGVGKTSLGQSIARATGRKFVRVSLGGVHDEAEIRGHRRTYVGALPGNIIQAIRKAGTRNPVLMLDEIDKLGAGIHGDPASALLEVLDPEQNSTFRDNYLGVPFDLSHVLFIATANMLDTIPGPLRDRMEIIQLSGYTEEEKVQIARRYLVKRQLEANGLAAEQADITDAALREVVQGYTRESGVRNLEREVGSVFRRVAMRIAEGEAPPITVDTGDLKEILGQRRFDNEVAMRASLPGVATGLAWTPVGGDILFIEATRLPGSGRLTLTGQLGDVMKESAQAAFSLVRSRARALGIDEEAMGKTDVHVHVPAGATPKDGPSAGVAMFMALTSLLTNRPVAANTAMTGEISLRGLVLPVGGIKEKVIAASRAGIVRVMLPSRNRRDFDDIPAEVREAMEFVWLDTVDQAVAAALDPAPAEAVAA